MSSEARRRLGRLEKKNRYLATTLVCPECKEEFTAYGDVALELVVADWAGAAKLHESPADIQRLLDHEHDGAKPEFVEKMSGQPFKAVCGINPGGEGIVADG